MILIGNVLEAAAIRLTLNPRSVHHVKPEIFAKPAESWPTGNRMSRMLDMDVGCPDILIEVGGARGAIPARQSRFSTQHSTHRRRLSGSESKRTISGAKHQLSGCPAHNCTAARLTRRAV